jgi:hypothetical protein
LNDHILVYKQYGQQANLFEARFPNERRRRYSLEFDEEFFNVNCPTKLTAADKTIHDMILESQGQRRIEELTIRSDDYE